MRRSLWYKLDITPAVFLKQVTITFGISYDSFSAENALIRTDSFLTKRATIISVKN